MFDSNMVEVNLHTFDKLVLEGSLIGKPPEDINELLTTFMRLAPVFHQFIEGLEDVQLFYRDRPQGETLFHILDKFKTVIDMATDEQIPAHKKTLLRSCYNKLQKHLNEKFKAALLPYTAYPFGLNISKLLEEHSPKRDTLPEDLPVFLTNLYSIAPTASRHAFQNGAYHIKDGKLNLDPVYINQVHACLKKILVYLEQAHQETPSLGPRFEPYLDNGTSPVVLLYLNLSVGHLGTLEAPYLDLLTLLEHLTFEISKMQGSPEKRKEAAIILFDEFEQMGACVGGVHTSLSRIRLKLATRNMLESQLVSRAYQTVESLLAGYAQFRNFPSSYEAHAPRDQILFMMGFLGSPPPPDQFHHLFSIQEKEIRVIAAQAKRLLSNPLDSFVEEWLTQVRIVFPDLESMAGIKIPYHLALGEKLENIIPLCFTKKSSPFRALINEILDYNEDDNTLTLSSPQDLFQRVRSHFQTYFQAAGLWGREKLFQKILKKLRLPTPLNLADRNIDTLICHSSGLFELTRLLKQGQLADIEIQRLFDANHRQEQKLTIFKAIATEPGLSTEDRSAWASFIKTKMTTQPLEIQQQCKAHAVALFVEQGASSFILALMQHKILDFSYPEQWIKEKIPDIFYSNQTPFYQRLSPHGSTIFLRKLLNQNLLLGFAPHLITQSADDDSINLDPLKTFLKEPNPKCLKICIALILDTHSNIWTLTDLQEGAPSLFERLLTSNKRTGILHQLKTDGDPEVQTFLNHPAQAHYFQVPTQSTIFRDTTTTANSQKDPPPPSKRDRDSDDEDGEIKPPSTKS